MEKQTKKTIRVYYEEFPEPYKSQAIFNADSQIKGKIDINITTVDNIVESLCTGFRWLQTPQGHGYWEDFFYELKAKNYAPIAAQSPVNHTKSLVQPLDL
jgi:hypothetical protein